MPSPCDLCGKPAGSCLTLVFVDGGQALPVLFTLCDYCHTHGRDLDAIRRYARVYHAWTTLPRDATDLATLPEYTTYDRWLREQTDLLPLRKAPADLGL